ncbi:beta-ketoacyl-[acyl-carrier-protein] synthase family protein [Xanthomonas graminis]|uniref:Nodulation protein E n=1 Tax=Xanthomonas graminis pv. phlei TaxID=487906 RepID=A0A0K2ZIA4_9XANT|nr:beta-ketoacyl-[acyl-carrier-protein] synthase family protein [Xanthomonas translucens]UKE64408.1 beta-ketoacyl-[acyl-carrier-protein] synthase family protein [Xanthomonas translucens pv. phlei]UKE74913.1 beta-ketoacyl-[acyl-carrier-protein] synthase family protein [Xanthomonas translucens pv. phleipratensis]CTP85363.1 Nodulation protein E [Xanthomonas translucens pv. phlei]
MYRSAQGHRVVVTGMGAVSALGLGADALWRGMCEGRSGIAALATPDPQATLKMRLAASVPDFAPQAAQLRGIAPGQLDRMTQMALVAACEAVDQSGLALDGAAAARAAVVIGTGVGAELSRDEQSRRLYREQAERLHPLTIVRSMNNAPVSQISIAFGLRGPAFAVSSACASANHALAQAALLIRHGLADVAIAGGSEACLSLPLIRAWEAMRVVSNDTCRPFCAQRSGLVLGEGAGIFVLESAAHAAARGAVPLAELAGFGLGADAHDIVAPSADGAAVAMRLALQDAGLEPQQIDYINAHGTGTLANDRGETQAIRQVFGRHANALAVSSTKAVHGHALGAAGALELVAAIGALREQRVPPTANFLDADPDCDLDYVPNQARAQPVRAVLSNSFAFGGLNAVLALREAR